jgi:hypothetical protein
MKKIDQISTYNQHHLLISFLRNINRRKDEQAVCTLVRTQTIGRSSQYLEIMMIIRVLIGCCRSSK